MDAVIAAGGQGRVAPWNGPINEGEIVMASFPPDQNGEVAAQAVAAVIGGEAQLVVFEGPAVVPWKYVVDTLANVAAEEFLTTEFGEAAVRRRVCVVAAPLIEVADALTSTTSRGRLAPPVGVLLGPTRTVAQRDWSIRNVLCLMAASHGNR